MSTKQDTTFAARLAYVRWLRARGRDPETDEELATAVDLGVGWLRKWAERDDAPADRLYAAQLVRGLSTPPGGFPITADWLLDGRGEPPEPVLWPYWWNARKVLKGKR